MWWWGCGGRSGSLAFHSSARRSRGQGAVNTMLYLSVHRVWLLCWNHVPPFSKHSSSTCTDKTVELFLLLFLSQALLCCMWWNTECMDVCYIPLWGSVPFPLVLFTSGWLILQLHYRKSISWVPKIIMCVMFWAQECWGCCIWNPQRGTGDLLPAAWRQCEELGDP